MKIKLDEIQASPTPIRKSMDEAKLEELVQSIKERGVIVPPKVRENGNGYEVVYGHRRVEAAKRAGLKEIECLVEDVSDEDTMAQSWIENMLREDMSAWDIAEALGKIATLEGVNSTESLQSLGYGAASTLQLYWRLQEQPEEVKKIYRKPRPSSRRKATTAATVATAPAIETVGAVVAAGLAEKKKPTRESRKEARVNVLSDDGVAVVRKVADEGLSTKQASSVARAVAVAPTKTAKKKLLDTPFSTQVHDPEIVKAQTSIKDRKRKVDHEFSAEVSAIIKRVSMLGKSIDETLAAGKFSPEARRFVANKLDVLKGKLEDEEQR